jgi:phosphopantetheinyl transferase (holo-ACP synthase)
MYRTVTNSNILEYVEYKTHLCKIKLNGQFLKFYEKIVEQSFFLSLSYSRDESRKCKQFINKFIH